MDQIIKASQELVAMEVTLDGRTITGFKVLKAVMGKIICKLSNSFIVRVEGGDHYEAS